MNLYADIIVPIARGPFTFEVGQALRGDIGVGRCVQVQLGPNKRYIGVVWKLHDERPPYKVIKSIDKYVVNAPVLGGSQLKLWEWIAGYYMCTLGEVMRAALPSALKPEGFSDEEFTKDTYRPPVVRYVALHGSIADTDTLNAVCETLARRAKKQYHALMSFVGQVAESDLFSAELPRAAIDADSVVLNKMFAKEIFRFADRELRPGELPPLPGRLPELSQSQQNALNIITDGFATKDVALLQGVTGSGKTEIYINLIDEHLAKGRNVLYLLPEIAMTGQLVERIKGYFGDRVITYHSRVSDRARVEAYRRINQSRGGELIMGVRSALFLPVNDLGLVIVDEEHDPSYKQEDPAPRYNARDSAIMLARIHGAKTLLGSATPSLESYANASEGKYIYAKLSERFGDSVPPRIIISDTLTAAKRGERHTHFNKLLLDKIAGAVEAHKQVILFQNRRGFSPYVECGECGWTASCPNCNVTLTLHKQEGKLRCHYCGYSKSVPHNCPSCNHPAINPMGFGTEKVEEELALLFPGARIERLDRDTAQSVRRYNEIIASFERGQTDILIGTQMITKGFDFSGVSLVGILNADNLLNYPDFRASERAFQLMVQVAGRAGRRQDEGEVVIQTSQPQNLVIQQVASYDYEAMVRGQLAERSAFFYPPYCRLVLITFKHRNRELLWQAANIFADNARKVFGKRLTGPQPPAVDRIRGEHLLCFMLKVERTASFAKAKAMLSDLAGQINSDARYRYITIVFDPDPQ